MHAAPALSPYADLARIVRDLNSSQTSAENLTAGLSDSELNWQPGDGRAWSILQCLEHLALTNEVYAAAMRVAVTGAQKVGPFRNGPLRASLPGALFLKNLEPPVKFKVPAPRGIIPAGGKNKADVLDALSQSHRQIRALVLDARTLNLNRLVFRNPFLPVLRVRFGTALLIITAHERRHLWQAGRVRAAVANP